MMMILPSTRERIMGLILAFHSFWSFLHYFCELKMFRLISSGYCPFSLVSFSFTGFINTSFIHTYVGVLGVGVRNEVW